MFQKSDECILGDGDIVEQMLSATRQQMERKYTLMAQGYNLRKLDLLKLQLGIRTVNKS